MKAKIKILKMYKIKQSDSSLIYSGLLKINTRLIIIWFHVINVILTDSNNWFVNDL